MEDVFPDEYADEILGELRVLAGKIAKQSPPEQRVSLWFMANELHNRAVSAIFPAD